MTKRIALDTHVPRMEQYVDRALYDPMAWTEVLNQASALVGASAATLVVRKRNDLALIDPVAATWDDIVSQDYVQHFGRYDVVPTQMGASQRGSSVVLQELVDIGAFSRTEFFNDWANRHQIAYFAGITFNINEHAFGVMSFHRESSDPEFTHLERQFIEHIAVPVRFALRHRRLTRELATARGALDRLALGVILLDKDGTISYSNDRATDILGKMDGLTVTKNGRLRAANHKLTERLDVMIRNCLSGDVGPRGSELFIPRRSEALPLHVVAVPLSYQVYESLMDVYVPTAVFINDMREEEHLGKLSEMFRNVFGCTELQAEIACGLINGAKNRDLVTEGRNQETVRSHIKAVYSKTNVNSRPMLCKLARQMSMQVRPDISRPKRR